MNVDSDKYEMLKNNLKHVFSHMRRLPMASILPLPHLLGARLNLLLQLVVPLEQRLRGAEVGAVVARLQLALHLLHPLLQPVQRAAEQQRLPRRRLSHVVDWTEI